MRGIVGHEGLAVIHVRRGIPVHVQGKGGDLFIATEIDLVSEIGFHERLDREVAHASGLLGGIEGSNGKGTQIPRRLFHVFRRADRHGKIFKGIEHRLWRGIVVNIEGEHAFVHVVLAAVKGAPRKHAGGRGRNVHFERRRDRFSKQGGGRRDRPFGGFRTGGDLGLVVVGPNAIARKVIEQRKGVFSVVVLKGHERRRGHIVVCKERDLLGSFGNDGSHADVVAEGDGILGSGENNVVIRIKNELARQHVRRDL